MEAVIVAFCSVLYFAVAFVVAGSKLLWYDELFTLTVIESGTVPRMLQTLREGLDLQPIAFFVVTKLTQWVGEDEISLRLPAIFGFWLAGLCLYLIQRRWLPSGYAIATMTVPWLVFFDPLGVEARPYGLVMACAALALLGWTYRMHWPRAANLVFLAGVLGAALFHYYGFLAVLPFVPAALWRFWRFRKIDGWTLAACVLGVLPNLFSLPLIQQAISFHSEGAWNAPRWSSLLDPYTTQVSILNAALVTAFTILLFRPREQAPVVYEPPDRETVICWLGFCALPAVALVLAKTMSGMISPRYYSMWILGYGLLLIQLIAHAAAHSIRFGHLLAVVTMAVFLSQGLTQYTVASGRRSSLFELTLGLGDTLREPGNSRLNLAVTDALLALQMVHYAPELRDRIVFLADLPLALRYLNTDSVHKDMIRQRGRFPLRVERLEDYLNRPQQFLVFNTRQNSFLEDYLSITPGLRERVHWIWAKRDVSFFAVDPPGKPQP
jgi:hypothetical protein